MKDPKKKPPPPVFLLLALIAIVLLDRFAPLAEFGSRWTWAAGALLLAAGLVVAANSAQRFRRAGTPLRPFEESTAVVTTGLFRYTRNPMYLGMFTVLAGIALMLGSAGAFVPIPLFVLIIRNGFVVHEEAFMERLFGEEYLAYKRRVRRWF